ncbi:trace amine-associated receptor 13c [Biomphalaria glabrata]|nr:trace amine-associated receptor 13c [Biomphalaria glabrata]
MNLSDCFNPIDGTPIITSSAIVIINAVATIITVFTVISNCIIFISLVKSISKSNNRLVNENMISKCTMTSFLVVEILLGITLMPLLIIRTSNRELWTLGLPMLWLQNFMHNFICALTLAHMLTMAVDRYLAVCHPLSYRLLTSRHASVIVVLSWGVPGIIDSIYSIVNYSNARKDIEEICLYTDSTGIFIFIFVVMFLLPIFLITFLYVRILLEVRNFHKRTLNYKVSDEPTITNYAIDNSLSRVSTGTIISETQPNSVVDSVLPGTETCLSSVGDPVTERHGFTTRQRENQSSNIDLKKAVNKNMKAYRHIGCIIVSSVVCWLPLGMFSGIKYLTKMSVPDELVLGLMWITYSNAAINPLVYCLNRSIRRDVKDLVCKIQRRRLQ